MKKRTLISFTLLLSVLSISVSCSMTHDNYKPPEKVFLFQTNWISPYLRHPTDMFIATNDRIFIIDATIEAVEIFDKNMNYIDGWTNTFFDTPFGITVNPKMDKIYIADTWNDRMVVYSMFGQLLTNIDGISFIRDILVDNQDNVFVLANVGLFRMNSNYQIQTNAPYSDCFGLVFDGYGNICTVDKTNIYKFRTNDLSLAGSFPITWGGNYSSMIGADLAISKDKTQFYKVNHPGSYCYAYVDIYNTNGSFSSKIDVLQIDGFFLSANTAISFDSSGKLFMLAADYNDTNYRVFKFK